MSIISLVWGVYTVYLPYLSSPPPHLSILALPHPWFLITPCPLLSRRNGEKGWGGKSRVEGEIVERRVTAAYGEEREDGGLTPLFFYLAFRLSPLPCAFSSSLMHTHIAGVSGLLCLVVFPKGFSASLTQLRSALCCPCRLTTIRTPCMPACLHTNTHISLQGDPGIHTDRKYLQNTLLTCKQSRHVRHACWFAKPAPIQPCSVQKQRHCFCPACEHESAFCLNYRAALWILCTTHILSRHC